MLFAVSDSRTVLVFGGGRGIGEAVARGFASEGAKVTVVSRTGVEVENVADEIGGRAMTADVGDADAVGAVFSECGPVDVVVNAAAIQGGEGAIGELWNTEPAAVASVIQIDFLGSYHVLRESIRSMREHGVGGSVITISGGGSTKPRPRFGAYGASKCAVLRLIESTALELRESGSGIRIFAAAPGAVHTEMTQEVLDHAALAGKTEEEQARMTSRGGGVSAEQASRLCRFLAKTRAAPLSGRLVHVNEDYEAIAARELSDAAGCLRRMGFEEH